MKKFAFLIPLLLLQLTLSGQEKQLKAWEKSVRKGEVQAAEAVCTPQFWMKEFGDSGQEFYEQSSSKGFKLLVRRTERNQADTRAVMLTDIRVGRKIVDAVYLYWVKMDEGWRFDGVNESKENPAWFLRGQIPGHFHPLDLSASAGLIELGEQAMFTLEALRARKDDFYEKYLRGISREAALKAMYEFEPVEVDHTCWSEELHRGALQLKNAKGELLSLYFLPNTDPERPKAFDVYLTEKGRVTNRGLLKEL